MSPVAHPRRRLRPRASTSLSIILFAALAFLSSQLIESAAGAETTTPNDPPALLSAPASALPAVAALRPSTPVAPAAPPVTTPAPVTTTATTPTTPPPIPAPSPVPTPPVPAATPGPGPGDPGAVPPVGQASAWGCSAALAYLESYAAKGFTFECPGYAEGHEAMTCLNVAGVCPGAAVIAIADPCPQAYMNETSNSFVITGTSEAPIDPFGPCP